MAEANYIQSRLQLDIAAGRVLDVYSIEIDEAKKGHVLRAPNDLPVAENKR